MTATISLIFALAPRLMLGVQTQDPIDDPVIHLSGRFAAALLSTAAKFTAGLPADDQKSALNRVNIYLRESKSGLHVSFHHVFGGRSGQGSTSVLKGRSYLVRSDGRAVPHQEVRGLDYRRGAVGVSLPGQAINALRIAVADFESTWPTSTKGHVFPLNFDLDLSYDRDHIRVGLGPIFREGEGAWDKAEYLYFIRRRDLTIAKKLVSG